MRSAEIKKKLWICNCVQINFVTDCVAHRKAVAEASFNVFKNVFRSIEFGVRYMRACCDSWRHQPNSVFLLNCSFRASSSSSSASYAGYAKAVAFRGTGTAPLLKYFISRFRRSRCYLTISTFSLLRLIFSRQGVLRYAFTRSDRLCKSHLAEIGVGHGKHWANG